MAMRVPANLGILCQVDAGHVSQCYFPSIEVSLDLGSVGPHGRRLLPAQAVGIRRPNMELAQRD
jgi:hypothetical protein